MDAPPTTSLSLLAKLLPAPVNQAAWEQWVQRYVGTIYGWCRHWGLQDADARDLTQEVLTRVFLHLHTYDRARGPFRRWLQAITRNLWADLRRRQAKDPPGSGDSQVLELLCQEPAREDFLQRLEATYDLELLDQVYAAVQQRVAPDTWEMFRLSKGEGLPAGEVARRAHKKRGMVYVAVCRVQELVKEEVRRRLGGEASGGTEDAP